MKRIGVFGVAVAVLLSVWMLPALATDTNQVGHWCETGVKFEPVDTPFVVPQPPAGTTWTLIVVKSGSGEGENATWENPQPGETYSHPSGRDNSHVILCWEELPVTTTTSTPSSTTTTTTIPATTTTATTVPPSTTSTTEPPTTTTTTSISTTTVTLTPSTSTTTVPPSTTIPPEPPSTTQPPVTTTTLPCDEGLERDSSGNCVLPITGARDVLIPLAVISIGLIALGFAWLIGDAIVRWRQRKQQRNEVLG